MRPTETRAPSAGSMGPIDPNACTNPSTALDNRYDWANGCSPGRFGMPRSCALFCTTSSRTKGALRPSRSKFDSNRNESSGVTDRLRPHASVESICTLGRGTLTEIDPVTRLTLNCTPVWEGGSGLARYPYETCRLTGRTGLAERRTANESSECTSKFQRSSSGSRPLNQEPSSLTVCVYRPAVATPKLTCVESIQWWDSGGNGSPSADARCMNAGGPSAGSPTGAR